METHFDLLKKYSSFELPNWGNISDFEKTTNKSTLLRKLDRNYFPISSQSFQFENEFPFSESAEFMSSNWSLIFGIAATYLAVIFGLQEFMKNRKPINLKRSLFVWSWINGILSLAGFLRAVPELWKFVGREYGFYESVCIPNYTSTFGFIFVAYAISKIAQLADTIFLVLKKKPLDAVQWYHHTYTLVGAWICVPYMEALTRYIIILNLGEHSLMYPYLGLKAIGVKIPRKVGKFVATYQFLQMVTCMGVNILSAYYYVSGTRYCHRHPVSLALLFTGNVIFVGMFWKQFTNMVLKSQKKVN